MATSAPKAQLQAEMDTSGVRQGFKEIESGAKGMGAALQKAGDQGDQAFKAIEEGAKASASSMTRSESAIIASITRTTNRLQQAGKTASEAFAFKIETKGLDASKFEPAIQKLREAEAAAKAFQDQLRADDAAKAASASQQQFIANLREQISLQGKSTEEVLRYRAAQLGIGDAAAPLILQLQNQKAAQTAAAQAAREEAQAQQQAAAAKQRAIDQGRAFVASLQEQVALQGKSQADVLRYRAAQLGVSADAEKFIAQLERSNTALGKTGVSAGQTAAALRQLPAQFTDIVTSLQAGQAPLTVLLQQGGQIKDSFGGAGAALRETGKFLLGLVSPTTVAVAAVAALGFAYVKGAEEAEAFQRTLILTGNAAGVTAQQLSAIAASITASGITQGAAADALNQLAQTGKVGAENLGRFAAAAVELQRVGGPAVDDTVKAFAELGKAPLQASLKLNESTNFLTASLYDQIKALEEQGKTTEAAKVAQEAYASAVEQRIPALAANLGILESAWLKIKDATKKAADAALNIGRPKTLDDLQKDLADAESRLESYGGRRRQREEQNIAALRQQIALQADLEDKAQVSAQQEADRLKKVQARSEFDKIATANLDKQAKLKLEIRRIEELGIAAGKTRFEIETQIAAAREKAADKSALKDVRQLGDEFAAQRTAAKEWADAFGDFAKIQRDAEAATLGLTKGQARLVEYLLSPAYQNASEEMRQLALQQAYAAITAEQFAQAQKDATKAAEQLARESAQINDRLDEWLRSANEQKRLYEDEQQLAGLTRLEREKVVAARQVELKLAKELAKIDASGLSDEAKAEARIKARQAAEIESSAAVAKVVRDDWARTADQIEQSLTDALVRGFDSGKGMVQSLRDYIVNAFKTTVIKIGVKAILQSGGLLGDGLAGLLGLSSSGANGIGGGLGGLGGSIGAALGLDKLGLGSVSSIASALSSVAGVVSVLQGKYASGAGTAIGSVLGGPVGAIIGNSIGSAIDKAFGSVGTHQAGGAYLSNGTTGQFINNGSYGLDRAWGDSIGRYFSQGVQTALQTITGTGAGLLNTVSTAFGGMGGYQVGAFFASDNNRASQGNRSVLGPNGQILSSWSGSGLSSDPTTGLQQLTTALAGDVRSALQQIDIPGWAKSQLQALTGDVSFEQLAGVVQNIIATKDALKSLGDALPQLANLSDSAVEGLLKAFNGIDGLKTAASSYYDNFYTDAEKSAAATAALTKELAAFGLSVPTTREAYRALVEAQDLNTESGRAAYAELLKLSPAFAALVPATQALVEVSNSAAEAAAAAAAKMAEAGRKVLADLADQSGGLQVDLLRAQGRTAEAAALERQRALLKLTEGLTAQDAAAATAAYDYNLALKAQADQLNAAAAAAQQAAQAEAQRLAVIEQQRSGLQDQLDQLLGNTAALRERELAALDPSVRALQERIYAIQDERAAQEAATQAAQAAAQAAEQAAQAEAQRVAAIASERTSLESQLLQLLGDTAELRRRELDSLDPSNRAIQERIYALQDEQAASQAAAQAAQEAAQKAAEILAQRTGLENQLLQLQGNTTELRRRELEALDPANRALQELIYSLQDQQAASQSAAQAAQELAAKQAAVVSQRDSIQARIDELMGNTAAIRERELAALDPANRALQERYYALLDQRQAEQEASQAAQQAAQAAQQAAQAAEQLRQSWQSVVDGLLGEVDRIRGAGASAPRSLAEAQARFAVVSAQARAGDQEAAKLLPALSQALISLAQSQASSASELDILKARTASSLSATAGLLATNFGLTLPKFAVGTNYVPHDMAAIVHEGEAIVPRAYNPAAGGMDKVVRAIEALQADMRVQAAATSRVQRDVLAIQKSWEQNGMPPTRDEGVTA